MKIKLKMWRVLKRITRKQILIGIVLFTFSWFVLEEVLHGNERLTTEDLQLLNTVSLTKENIQSAIESLTMNPIYSAFDIVAPLVKEKVTLLLIVSTGPRRSDRRNAIRETWWKQCVSTNEVIPKCIFMTDHQQINDSYYHSTLDESQTHNDMYFQKLSGGIEFGRRFLYHLVWAKINFDFDYFMRVDDDYMLCLERFLHEIPSKKLSNFHWGYTHQAVGIVRPEESIIMFSADVVETFLAQDSNELLCLPFADQMMAAWMSKIPRMRTLLRHDARLHHTPPVGKKSELLSKPNVCHSFIGIHGCYPECMRTIWSHRGILKFDSMTPKEKNRQIGNLIDNSVRCKFTTFNWRKFVFSWRYKPKLCITNPTWDTSEHRVIGGVYAGRQEGGEIYAPSLIKRVFLKFFSLFGLT